MDPEHGIHLLINVFPSSTRDFVFCRVARPDADIGAEKISLPVLELLQPLELLKLDRATQIIERLKSRAPNLALVLALCRLLVPCLEYRGNRRHLVVEPWSEPDLRGETLYADTRTDFARDLAAEQAEEFRVITQGEVPPKGSFAELFWQAHTELPWLPERFEDPQLGRFAKALYFALVPDGEGRADVDLSQIRSYLLKGWEGHFADLGLGLPGREMRRLFKRLLAAAIRLGSQLNGQIAKELVLAKLADSEQPTAPTALSPEEEELLELRYGACKALGDINIGLLFGCGPLFAELVNDFAYAHVADTPPEQKVEAKDQLHRYIDLLTKLRQRRKLARAEEKRELRGRYADRRPGMRRKQAQDQKDLKAKPPDEPMIRADEMELLRSLLPHLKPHDATRLQVLIECHGDRALAAEKLGMELATFSRQWRQTTLPNIKLAVKELNLKRT